MPTNHRVPVHGDRIEIPKGIAVYDTGILDDKPILTARRTNGTVRAVVDLGEDHRWQRFLTEADQDLLRDTAMRLGLTCRFPWRDAWHHGVPEFDAVRIRILSMHGGDLRFVDWGARMAHVSEVRVVEAEPSKERSVTLRTLMTPGSVWRTTRDVRLTGMVSTRDMERKRFALLPPLESDAEEQMSRIVLTDIPAGTEFTVKSGSRQRALGGGNGLAVPVTMPIDELSWHVEDPTCFFQNPLVWNGLHLPINQIKDAVEQVAEGDPKVFVLKDRDTGLFFGGFTYDHVEHREHVRMVGTFAGSRKYGSPANAKASILAFTGRIPERSHPDGDRPEWVGWERKIDLPSGWHLMEVDRITLEERPSTDIQSWYASLVTGG